jgi:hypothetical protein
MRLPFARPRPTDRDPYWEAFINKAPADPNNVIPHAFSQVQDGETNPVCTEVHSPNTMSSHIKELGRFYGADLIGIVAVPTGGRPASDQEFAIVTVLKAEYDPRTAAGVGGQTPALKGLFATFTLAAYIRELGYRATRAFAEDNRGDRLAAAAGLGDLTADGRLVTRRFGRGVYIAEVIVTDLPLQPDGRENVA